LALRRQTQVMALNDRMAGRRLGHAMPEYGRVVGGALREALTQAKSAKGLRARLTAAMLERMSTPGVEEALAITHVIAHGVGRTTAQPGARTRKPKGDRHS